MEQRDLKIEELIAELNRTGAQMQQCQISATEAAQQVKKEKDRRKKQAAKLKSDFEKEISAITGLHAGERESLLSQL